MKSILTRCIIYACNKHEDQIYRGYGIFKDEPYICHLLRVMLRCSQKRDADKCMQVAILHDVLEDTDANLEEIRKETGVDQDILEAVFTITKSKNEEYSAYIERISESSILVQTVKIEDLFENLSRNPPEELATRYRKAIVELGFVKR